MWSREGWMIMNYETSSNFQPDLSWTRLWWVHGALPRKFGNMTFSVILSFALYHSTEIYDCIWVPHDDDPQCFIQQGSVQWTPFARLMYLILVGRDLPIIVSFPSSKIFGLNTFLYGWMRIRRKGFIISIMVLCNYHYLNYDMIASREAMKGLLGSMLYFKLQLLHAEDFGAYGIAG